MPLPLLLLLPSMTVCIGLCVCAHSCCNFPLGFLNYDTVYHTRAHTQTRPEGITAEKISPQQKCPHVNLQLKLCLSPSNLHVKLVSAVCDIAIDEEEQGPLGLLFTRHILSFLHLNDCVMDSWCTQIASEPPQKSSQTFKCQQIFDWSGQAMFSFVLQDVKPCLYSFICSSCSLFAPH